MAAVAVASLRDDAFRAQAAGVLEDRRAVAVEVLASTGCPGPPCATARQGRAADFPWFTAQVVAVEFKQIEPVQEDGARAAFTCQR